MIWPVKKVYITQKWGVNKDRYKRFNFLGHNGIDLRLFNTHGNKASTALVFAPHDGIIRERRFDADGYGNYLKIESNEHGSILGHLKEFKVNVNKNVKEGDLVAIADNTGWSTGSHLHWGYYKQPRDRQNGYGGTINPIPHIKPNGIIDKPSTGEADMTDKPKIDLGSPWGELEIQAIKSKLDDGLRDFTNLEKKYKDLLENPPSGGISTEQITALGDVLKKVTAAQFELTNKKIQAVQVAVDLTEANLTGDREGLGTMQVNQASMLTEMREFKTLLTSQTKKIGNAVKSAVEKAIIDVSDKIKVAVTEALKGFTNDNPKLREKTFWEKLQFWKK